MRGINTITYVKGSAQCSENIVTIVFNTIFAFVKSVAVHSIKTFFVFNEIFEWSPLMIGGKEQTTRFAS